MITHPIKSLAAAGISEIAIVVGYLGDQVKEKLGDGSAFGVRLSYLWNHDYCGGNAMSVHCAGEWLQDSPGVVCMGDHLIEAGMVSRLMETRPDGETLCVDFRPAGHHDVEEATKVAIDGTGRIMAIGKDLIGWDALDTGVFLVTGIFLGVLDELVRQRGIDVGMSDVVRLLVSRGNRFATCDVSGLYWADVDTEDDLAMTVA